MAVLSFPDPASTQTYTENGVTYVWDGQKWVTSGTTAFVPLSGAAMSGSTTVPERTVGATFDLSEGPYWTAGAIDIPNPTNAIAGMGGLIRLSAEPTSWGSYFYFSGGVTPTGTGNIPFYVESPTYICLGKVTPGA